MDAFVKLQRIDRVCDGLTELVFRKHVLCLVLQDATDEQLDVVESLVIKALGRPQT